MCWCITKAAFKLIMAMFRMADGSSDVSLGVATKEGTKLYKTLSETNQISFLLEDDRMSSILTAIGIFGMLVGIYEFYWGFIKCKEESEENHDDKWIAKVNIIAFVVEDLPSLAINIFILMYANTESGDGDELLSGDGTDVSATARRLMDAGDDGLTEDAADDEEASLVNSYISMGLSAGAGLLYLCKYCRAKYRIKQENRSRYPEKNGNVSCI